MSFITFMMKMQMKVQKMNNLNFLSSYNHLKTLCNSKVKFHMPTSMCNKNHEWKYENWRNSQKSTKKDNCSSVLFCSWQHNETNLVRQNFPFSKHFCTWLLTATSLISKAWLIGDLLIVDRDRRSPLCQKIAGRLRSRNSLIAIAKTGSRSF